MGIMIKKHTSCDELKECGIVRVCLVMSDRTLDVEEGQGNDESRMLEVV